MKEFEYTDNAGIKHDVEIFESNLDGDTVYTVHQDGNYFVDLVKDEEGQWIELYGGKTARSEEYGKLVPKD